MAAILLGTGARPHKSAEHPVGLLKLFLEAVVFQDEIAATICHSGA